MRLLTMRNHTAVAASPSGPGEGMLSKATSYGMALTNSLSRGMRSVGLLFNRQLITLDVKDGELRFVVFRRGRVVRWGMVTLDGGGDDQEATALQLKALVHELGLVGHWVVSLPLRAALVRRLALPKIERRYLGQVVASEVAERIPFPVEQVDLAWAMEQGQKGQQVVAVVVPKEVMDRTVVSLKAAGLTLAAMYPRAMALAYAAGSPKAGVVVDLGVSSVGVVLVENGVPQMVHEVELSGGREGEAAAISHGVEQVLTQYQEPEDGENKSLPVLVTGSRGAKGMTREEVEGRLGRKAAVHNPAVGLPGHFVPAEYAVNLGLFFAYEARQSPLRRASQGTVVSANVLPKRHRAQPLPLLPAGVFLSIALFAYAAMGLRGDLGDVVSRRDVLASRLVSLEGQERLHRLDRIKTEADKKRAAVTNDLADKIEARMDQMRQEINAAMIDLNMISSEAAAVGLQITGTGLSGDGYSVSGNASSRDVIIAYAGRLRRSGTFQDVAITSIQTGTSASPGPDGTGVEPGMGGVSFQLKASTSQSAPVAK